MKTPDPFDPARLRLDPSASETFGVKKLLTTVPVGKPSKQEFFRTHPDEAYRLSPAAVVEMEDDREFYLLTHDVARELPGEFKVVTLHWVINRQSVLRVWPLKLPAPDGRPNAWHDSAMEAAELSMKKWVRLSANMSLGAYDVSVATGELPEPSWPLLSFGEVLKIAFRGHYIDSLDHPLIKRLQGFE